MRIALAIIFLVCNGVSAGEPQSKKTAGKSKTPVSTGIVRFKKKVDAGALQAQLVSAGFAIDFIECSVDNCTIHMPPTETKDPLPIVEKYVYVDPREAHQKKLTAMKALYDKWQAGTITNDEKDQLLKQLVALVLGLN